MSAPGRTGDRARTRLVAAGLVIALLAGACGFSTAKLSSRVPKAGGSSAHRSAANKGPVTPGPGGFRARLTAWGSCSGPNASLKFECAELTVPLDWSKPTGRTIKLAVSRLHATDPNQRIGSLLMNPGGPGAGGVDFLQQIVDSHRLPADLNKSFDLVSWDPRGTGNSSPISCSTPADLAAPDVDPTPDNQAEADAIVLKARKYSEHCDQVAGDLLPYVGTKNTVRDLDALRSALGDAKLTYLGYSYGTEIGIVYAQMFPANLRAMVLDGVAIPGADPVSDTHAQAQAFEKNLDSFLADCESRGGDCVFGDGDPAGALRQLMADLEAGKRIPAKYKETSLLARTATVGIGELLTAMGQALYAKDYWPDLEQALGQATAPHPKGDLLLLLRDLYDGRGDDGNWSSIQDSFAAISCADTAERPTSPLGDPKLRAAWAKELPFFGSYFATGTPPCWGVPKALEPLTQPADGSIRNVPPVVIIGGTQDPATPYAQALAAHKMIPDSVVVTWLNPDHTAYGRGSDCLDQPVTNYLLTVQLPKEGLRCN